MKINKKIVWVLMLTFACALPTLAQETIWSENFDGQTDGLDNGNYGPINSTNGKWSLALIDQEGTWTGSSDYIKVNNDLMEARDTDNRGEWSSVAIDVSAHSNVTISIDMSEAGNHETTDTLAAYYSLDGAALTAFDINGINTDDFTAVTASTSLAAGNSLQIFVHLKNNSGSEYLRFDNVVVSGDAGGGGGMPNPEPANHVSGIGFTGLSHSGFTVNWTDASSGDLPSAYLVKISEYTITAPVDGTSEANGDTVVNVLQGVQTASFSSLSANTTYNVAIYPYSNSGATIDYKLSATNNQTSTAEAPAGSVIFITEIADPDNSSNGRYIELYNNSASVVDLAGWKLQRYTNASSSAASPLNLSGTIGAYSTFVVGKSTFSSVYGFAPDMTSSNIAVDSNGDDNMELLNPSDERADIFGVPGEDGSGTNHEFEDGRAERNSGITAGNTTYTASEWTIDNDSGGGDGAISAPDGYDPGSWIGGTIALSVTSNKSEDNYQLAGNEQLTVSNGAALTITNGGQLAGDVIVESGSGIVINSGTLNNTNNITLKDGAYLYENGGTINNTGSFTVERNTTVDAAAFHFISSPISNADIQAVCVGSNVISYNPTNFVDDGMGNSDNFTAWVYHTTGVLDVARGYALSGSQTNSSGVRKFTGTPNSGNYSFGVLTSASGNPSGESWNLTGNPYPSAIQIGDFLTTNTAVIENGVYLWDDSVDDYVTKNTGMHASELLAVGQGFFVQAKTDNNISFTNSMRRGSTATFYKKAPLFTVDLILKNANGKENYTSLALAAAASDEKDAFYDSKKMFGNPNLSIYSLLNKEAYALQGFSLDGNKEIPIGLNVAVSGEFTIALGAAYELFDYSILMEDKLTGMMHPMKENSLKVFLNEGTCEDRFVLHIQDAKWSVAEQMDTEIAYTLENGVLRIETSNEMPQELILIDMSGRVLRRFEASQANISSLVSGTYILGVQYTTGMKYTKLIF